MEQVCSALNLLSLEWQENQRGTTRRQHKGATIAYHQRRNRAARESGQRKRRRRSSPKSYTKENVVEVSCHGSSYILQEIIQLFLTKGARLAKPGSWAKAWR